MATGGAGPSGALNVAQVLAEYHEWGIESTLGGDPESLCDCLYALATEAQKAGEEVRDAASECRHIKAYAVESAAIAEKRSAEFKRKATKICFRSKAEHYRMTAEKLDVAAKLTVRTADNFGASLSSADEVVILEVQDPSEYANYMRYMQGRSFPQGTMEVLNSALRNANYRIAYLKEDEYYVLKAMRRCWEEYPPPSESEALQNINADAATPLIPRDRTGNGPCTWIFTVLAILVAVVGFLLLILCATLRTDKYSFGSMLIVGILCLVCSMVYSIARIIRRKKELAYERRNFMLNLIDKRLNVLSDYFVTNRTDLLSDSDEENDPNLLIIRRTT